MRTKFFTGAGDEGKSRVGAKMVLKDDLLLEVLGDMDELNSWIGLCRTRANTDQQNTDKRYLENILEKIQELIFMAQAQIYGHPMSVVEIGDEEIKFLEEIIEEIDNELPKIKKFVLPGGSELAACLDIARAIARRLERKSVKYLRTSQVRKKEELLRFLNRLSSALFALARFANFQSGVKEQSPKYYL